MIKHPNRCLLMLISSMLIFGSIGVFRRLIPLPSATLACFRGFCGALFILIVTLAQKKKMRSCIDCRKLSLLILSGALIGVNWILLFEAYNYTTVATATLCYYMQPAIVMLLSPLLLGEALGFKKLSCVAVSVCGMVLVSGIIENGMPALSGLSGVLFGLGAALLYAVVVMINKRLPGVDSSVKTIVQLTSAAVAILPYVLKSGLPEGIDLSFTLIAMLLIVGFVHTGISYWLYFASIDGLKAQTVAVLSYLDPITALILSAVVLHEGLTIFGIFGAVLIIGAALWSETSPRLWKIGKK